MGRRTRRAASAVLDDALQVFWHRGFTAASARSLQQQSGSHPGSLYHRFGSKEDLFLAVVDHYIECVVMPRITEHLRSNDAVKGIRRFFQTAFDGVSPGCLLVNTAAEFGASNDQVQARVATGFELLIAGFRAQIDRDPRFDAWSRSRRRRLAQNLFVAFQGYLVVGKSQPNEKQRREYLASILETAFRPLV